MKSAAAIVVTLLVCSVSMGLGYLVPRTQMRTILQPSLSSTQIRQATATIPMIEKPQEPLIDLTGVKFSGLKGKALMKKSVPSLSEIKAAFPKHVWEKSDVKSLSFAAMDVLMAALPISLGVKYLLPTIAAPSLGSYFGWILYAIVTGTTALGMW